MSFWIKPETGTANVQIECQVPGDAAFYFLWSGGADTILVGTTGYVLSWPAPGASEWTQMTFTYGVGADGKGYGSLWYNGAFQAAAEMDPPNHWSDLVIKNTQAYIDDVRLYDVVLSEEEIKDLGGLRTDVTYPDLPSKMVVDIASNVYWATSINDPGSRGTQAVLDEMHQEDMRRTTLQGWHNSAMENSVLEAVTNRPTFSTARAFQLAGKTGSGMTVLKITPQSDPAMLDLLNLDPVIPGRPDIHPIKSAIAQSLDSGYTVLVPVDSVSIGTGGVWTGCGYVMLNSDGIPISHVIMGGQHGEVIKSGGAGTSAVADYIDVLGLDRGYRVGDPINIADGNVSHEETDVSLGGVGVPVQFTRYYNSFNTQGDDPDRGMGAGWSFTYGDYVSVSDTDRTWHTADGRSLTFELVGGTYTNPEGLFGTFTQLGSGSTEEYVWTDVSGVTYTFGHKYAGSVIHGFYLTRVADRFGNGVLVEYTANTCRAAHVSSLGDSSIVLTFTWHAVTGNIRLDQVTDGSRVWSYGYKDASTTSKILQSVSAQALQSGPEITDTYAYYEDPAREYLLASAEDPNGHHTAYSYYPNRRGFEVTDADGKTHRVEYDLYRNESTFVNEVGAGTRYFYDKDGHLLLQRYESSR